MQALTDSCTNIALILDKSFLYCLHLQRQKLIETIIKDISKFEILLYLASNL